MTYLCKRVFFFFFFYSIQSFRRLTAFIAKELTESRDIISVKDSYIQESMSYLISKQKSNGAWDDPNQLYDRGMKVQPKGCIFFINQYWLLTLIKQKLILILREELARQKMMFP